METKENGKSLFPITIAVDETMHDRLGAIWRQMREIGHGHVNFDHPGSFQRADLIRTERDAVVFIRNTTINQCRVIFDGLMRTARTNLPPAYDTPDQRFRRALQLAEETTTTMEDPHSLLRRADGPTTPAYGSVPP